MGKSFITTLQLGVLKLIILCYVEIYVVDFW